MARTSCRLCESEDADIFMSILDDHSLPQKISIVNVEVKQEDEFPTDICMKCINMINEATEKRQFWLENQLILDQMLHLQNSEDGSNEDIQNEEAPVVDYDPQMPFVISDVRTTVQSDSEDEPTQTLQATEDDIELQMSISPNAASQSLDSTESILTTRDKCRDDYEPKKNNRRISDRLRQRSKRSRSDFNENEASKCRSPNVVSKKQNVKKSIPTTSSTITQTGATSLVAQASPVAEVTNPVAEGKSPVAEVTSPVALETNPITPALTTQIPQNVIDMREYPTGSFLILRKDARMSDPNKHPSIWRVDSRTLLQKYEPFEDSGKIRHKMTLCFNGWSVNSRDLYAQIDVKVVTYNNNQKDIVECNWDRIKEINNDSDNNDRDIVILL